MKALLDAQDIFEKLVAWRRDFHMHPELGCEEHRTAGIAADVLRQLGFAVQTGMAVTGVIGILENGSGPVIMTRVDMDALPVQEANEVEYMSRNPGLMRTTRSTRRL